MCSDIKRDTHMRLPSSSNASTPMKQKLDMWQKVKCALENKNNLNIYINTPSFCLDKVECFSS